MNDRELTDRFAAAGRRFSYDEINAEFAAFREFKVRWTRNYRWASFEVSDYLRDAPGEVVTKLAETIFRRIRGEDSEYPEEVSSWLCSPEFVRAKQPLYVQRFVGLSMSGKGRHRDLAQSYGRLVESGLLTEDPDLYLGWSMPGRSRCIGRASVLMKVVAVSGILDTPDIPEDVFDYCVYSQAAHVSMGFNPGLGTRGQEYDALLSRFPDRMRMETELRRMALHI